MENNLTYTQMGDYLIPQSDRAGAAGPGPGQVREDAPAVLEGTPSGRVELHDGKGNPVQSSAGDRGRGERASGTDDAQTGESGGGDGTVESERPPCSGWD